MAKVELLAPAGNYESFLGAVHAGADAVYLGGDKFGARAFADNFSEEQLCKAIRYAHLFGRKVYLTLNTLIKEKEFGELYDYIKPYYEAGLDGIIVQDMGVFSFVRRRFPNLPLHVSTQMTVTGIHAARLLKKEGAVRIVPARELSLEEIKEIKEDTGLEMETFIHGAMCYCYSGQCLFSSILGGRSGNRGKCAQPCRLPYEILDNGKPVTGNVSSYPLSLKDMCTIEHIPDLIEAGIDSFKIEGRMKKPEYAAGVTAIYRKYIDLYYKKGRAGFKVTKEDMKMLEALYIRSEIQDGYYYRHNGKEMITHGAPGYSGSDDKLLLMIRSRYLEKEWKLPVKMQSYFYKGQEAVLTLSCKDVYVTVKGQVVQQAMKQPVTEQNIKDGLGALGETFFEVKEIEVDAQEDIFYPLKAIKDLRREAVFKLQKALEESNLPGFEPQEITETKEMNEAKEMHKSKEQNKPSFPTNNMEKKKGLRVLITQMEQVQGLLECDVFPDRVYLDGDICKDAQEWKLLWDKIKESCKEIFIVLPYIIRKRDKDYLQAISGALKMADGCMVRNMEGYGFLQEINYGKPVCADAGFYQWNKESRDFWLGKMDGFCIPYELSGREQECLTDEGDWEQVVYGRLPMMVTANCVAKTSKGCLGKSSFSFSLKDRYQTEFPVYTNCKHCYNVIYNSVPLSLHDKVSKDFTKQTMFRLDFTTEKPKQVKEILQYFDGLSEAWGDKKVLISRPYDQFTTGHEKKGAS